ncbi:UvrD-helicase domain-containing protein [Pseudoalteromonas translucida]|uniref:DNA 3'-5' helicase II n=1 Tax=Pseudoalteromonas translucida (strain TAC 125) TaxID=326442 RepID=Q3IKC7_PSET1|nr:UvrD-helicase domain-containing protein [Pseudoalteromonas translucida]CAI86171.1 DNA helicase II [Pseudoalteromonas translucida]|tara:strand:- start:146 stop:1993 length:1848 start_codon:yes stop_codon:yes gene_type:complete
MTKLFKPTTADKEIEECLVAAQSFSVVAGAGSGKTTSLVTALNFLRDKVGSDLRKNGQKIVCITYTKRATAVIEERLGFDELYLVSTIHSFLWSSISRFTKDIRVALRDSLIPNHIAKAREKDNGRNSQSAQRARARIVELTEELELLDQVTTFKYDESQFSSFSKGQIGHDDVIDLAAYLISESLILQRGFGFQFPYIFVDEAQDTFDSVIAAFNTICSGEGLPMVAYFGDPMQQIYDNGVGVFDGPEGFRLIEKEENFRSATSIVALTNKLRNDIQQMPAGDSALNVGSVLLTLIETEAPAGPRGRYTPEQLDLSLSKFDEALQYIGWQENKEAKRLFLVRQMIARRLGFSSLQNLFTGVYASNKAQDEYIDGDHFLVKPFIKSLCPLIVSMQNGNKKQIVGILREETPAFDILGINKDRPLKEMLDIAKDLVNELSEMWVERPIGDILRYAKENRLCTISERLAATLDREPRVEAYDNAIHAEEKSDWLADEFLSMSTNELLPYYGFVSDHTALSTQHGSKGEEYEDVLVVFDDIEASWNMYSFNKLLTPAAAGDGTEGQLARSRKLAYVCFSRARMNLRIFLYCQDAKAARAELVGSELLDSEQIEILPSR